MPAPRKRPEARQDNRPSRQRGPAPESVGAPGNAPEHLDAAERAAWLELLSTAPEGVLGKADRLSLEQACRLIAKSRTTDGLNAAGEALLHKVLTALGCTPAGRLHLALPLAPEPVAENPFAALEKKFPRR